MIVTLVPEPLGIGLTLSAWS